MADCLSTPQPRCQSSAHQSARKRRAPHSRFYNAARAGSKPCDDIEEAAPPKRLKRTNVSNDTDALASSDPDDVLLQIPGCAAAEDNTLLRTPRHWGARDEHSHPRVDGDASEASLAKAHVPRCSPHLASKRVSKHFSPLSIKVPSFPPPLGLISRTHCRTPSPVVCKATSSPQPRDRTPEPSSKDVFEPLPTPQAPRRMRHGCKLAHGIMKGNRREVMEALRLGEDPNAPVTITDRTTGKRKEMLPVLAAAKLSSAGIVEKLLEGGAVADSVTKSGRSGLHLLALRAALSPKDLCTGAATLATAAPPQSKGLEKQEKLPKSWLELSSFLENLGAERQPPSRRGKAEWIDDLAHIEEEPEFSTPTGKPLKFPISSGTTLHITRLGSSSPELHQTASGLADSDILATAKAFISGGSDISRKDKHGWTALDYARRAKHHALVALFESRARRSTESAKDCHQRESPSSPKHVQRSGSISPQGSPLPTRDARPREATDRTPVTPKPAASPGLERFPSTATRTRRRGKDAEGPEPASDCPLRAERDVVTTGSSGDTLTKKPSRLPGRRLKRVRDK